MVDAVWTEADVATLRQAIAAGARSVTYSDGRSVTYHSLRDMLSLLSLMTQARAGEPASRIVHTSYRSE